MILNRIPCLFYHCIIYKLTVRGGIFIELKYLVAKGGRFVP